MNLYDAAEEISSAPYWVKKNFFAPRSLTFRYARYRLLRPLLKINYKAYRFFEPVSPWTTQASIKTFRKILHAGMVGFEYGSGNSTVFFATRLKHLTSVEHNADWYNRVEEKIKHLNISNVDYHLVPIQHEAANTQPLDFYSTYGLTPNDLDVRNEYYDYFSFISKYPDFHFDFIIVDGRARVECSLLAIPKLKRGGIFVLDNSDRPRYEPIFKALRDWKSVTTTTGLFDTTIWFKP